VIHEHEYVSAFFRVKELVAEHPEVIEKFRGVWKKE